MSVKKNIPPSKKSSALPTGFSSSKTTDMDEVTKGLTAVFGKQSANGTQELSHIDHGRTRTWLWTIIGVAALLSVLASVAWLGLMWWNGRSAAAGFHVVVEGPSRVAIGQETSFFINWFNRSNELLSSADLLVTFPNDFVLKAAEPAAAAGTQGASFRYSLGAQSVNARGTIKVTGTFTGALGTQSAIQVIGTYRVTGHAADAEALATLPLDYADTVLQGFLEHPAKVLPGDKVTLAYRVRNTGQTRMEGMEARLTLPEGFVVDAAKERALIEGNVIRQALEPLDPDTSSTMRITGTFSLGVHGQTAVHAEVGRTTPDGAFAAALKTDGELSVLSGDLSMKLINGSDADRSVALGEQQRVSLSYENTSGEELQNIVLRLRLGGEPAITAGASTSIDLIDWKKLDASVSGNRDHDIVTFTQEDLPDLARLPAQGKGVIELSVPIVDTATSGRDVPLLASVEAVIGSVDNVNVNRTVVTRPLTLHLQTDAALTAVARYASEEGAPVGSGALPPVAGTSTTYRVEWTINKTLHALGRVAVSASLPKGVEFASVAEVTIGDMRYDADRRLVIWTVSDIPASAAESATAFNIKLTPSEADIGRFASLLGESRMEFTDATLNESLLRTAPALSTNMPYDALAKGKGVVRKP
jgi:hypothetical protein